MFEVAPKSVPVPRDRLVLRSVGYLCRIMSAFDIKYAVQCYQEATLCCYIPVGVAVTVQLYGELINNGEEGSCALFIYWDL